MASTTGTYSLNGEAWRSNPAAVGFKPSKMSQPIDANWYRSRYSSRSSLIEPVKSAKIRVDYRNKELKPPTPNWQSWHFRQSSPQRSELCATAIWGPDLIRRPLSNLRSIVSNLYGWWKPITDHYSEIAVIYWCHYNLPTSSNIDIFLTTRIRLKSFENYGPVLEMCSLSSGTVDRGCSIALWLTTKAWSAARDLKISADFWGMDAAHYLKSLQFIGDIIPPVVFRWHPQYFSI